jgi:hypothetical protein
MKIKLLDLNYILGKAFNQNNFNLKRTYFKTLFIFHKFIYIKKDTTQKIS